MQRRNLDLSYEDLFVTFSGEILVPAEDQHVGEMGASRPQWTLRSSEIIAGTQDDASKS